MTPGWFDDPEDGTKLRFWDGRKWTNATAERPDGPTTTTAPPAIEPLGPSVADSGSADVAGVPPPADPGAEVAAPSRGTPDRPPPQERPLAETWAAERREDQRASSDQKQNSMRLGAMLIGGVLLLGGCLAVVSSVSNKPSTRAELCTAYGEFANEWFTFSPSTDFFDDDAFDAMEDLADVAKRYPESEAVKSDGERLEDLAEGDGGFIVSVSVGSADAASRNIAAVCS